jgi:hypothetical protein
MDTDGQDSLIDTMEEYVSESNAFAASEEERGMSKGQSDGADGTLRGPPE